MCIFTSYPFLGTCFITQKMFGLATGELSNNCQTPVPNKRPIYNASQYYEHQKPHLLHLRTATFLSNYSPRLRPCLCRASSRSYWHVRYCACTMSRCPTPPAGTLLRDRVRHVDTCSLPIKSLTPRRGLLTCLPIRDNDAIGTPDRPYRTGGSRVSVWCKGSSVSSTRPLTHCSRVWSVRAVRPYGRAGCDLQVGFEKVVVRNIGVGSFWS